MSEQTTVIGDIKLGVGSYNQDGKTKTRSRTIGKLLKTGDRFWIDLHADILHASLYALASRHGMDKGDDTVSCNVFARDDRRSAPADDGQGQEPDEAF